VKIRALMKRAKDPVNSSVMLTEKKKTAKKILLANLENFKKLAPTPSLSFPSHYSFRATHTSVKNIFGDAKKQNLNIFSSYFLFRFF
jgi:hypothetical protein